MNLSERAILVNLNIQMWGGQKKDVEVTEAANGLFKAQEGAGSYQKHLLPRQAVEPIQRAASAARNYVYNITYPWTVNGHRLLPITKHIEFCAKMVKYREDYDNAVMRLEREYPKWKQEARNRLGQMFSESDYPADITEKFSFNIEFSPVPSGDDFRIQLAQEEIDKLKQQVDERSKVILAATNTELWQRFYRTIKHLADKLRDPEGRFKSSTVDNVREICELIEPLNLCDDPEINSLASEARESLGGIDVEALRTDPEYRESVVADADDIITKMLRKVRA